MLPITWVCGSDVILYFNPDYALEMNYKKIMLHIWFSTQFSVLNVAKATKTIEEAKIQLVLVRS